MFKYAPKNIDTQRDKIQAFLTHVGADAVKHSGRTLSIHLISTYDILKRNGHPDYVCAAGGMHSIFGTNIFQSATVDLEHKDIVAKIIGREALELVELFHSINRPSTLEQAVKNKVLTVETNDGKTITLTENQLNSLCAIEAANLSDQKSLKTWPEISKFLKRQ